MPVAAEELYAHGQDAALDALVAPHGTRDGWKTTRFERTPVVGRYVAMIRPRTRRADWIADVHVPRGVGKRAV